MKPVTDQQLYELAIQRAPDHYVASAFRGAGQYDKVETSTYGEALLAAVNLITNRPVAIYAIKGNSHSHVANYTRAGENKMAYFITWNRDRAAETPSSETALAFNFYRYVDRATAEAAYKDFEKREDPKFGALAKVVGEPFDLESCGGPWLNKIYNALNELAAKAAGIEPKSVARFATLSDARRRVFEALDAANLPVIAVPAHPEAKVPEGERRDQPATTAARDVVDVVAAHDEETTKMAKAKKVKAPKAPKEAKVVNYQRTCGRVADLPKRLIQAGSGRAAFIRMLDGKNTAEDIQKALKIDVAQTSGYLRWLSTVGVGCDVSTTGKLKAVYPGDKSIKDLVASEVKE